MKKILLIGILLSITYFTQAQLQGNFFTNNLQFKSYRTIHVNYARDTRKISENSSIDRYNFTTKECGFKLTKNDPYWSDLGIIYKNITPDNITSKYKGQWIIYNDYHHKYYYHKILVNPETRKVAVIKTFPNNSNKKIITYGYLLQDKL
jgi:hypothetical protein